MLFVIICIYINEVFMKQDNEERKGEEIIYYNIIRISNKIFTLVKFMSYSKFDLEIMYSSTNIINQLIMFIQVQQLK